MAHEEGGTLVDLADVGIILVVVYWAILLWKVSQPLP